MEVETGMARIYGYPDPNVGNISHNEPVRMPHPVTGNPGSDHTTGTGPGTDYIRTGENDYDHHDRNGGAGRGAPGYGADDGYDQSGVRTFEDKQPAIDRNTEAGPDPSGRRSLSPNRGPQSTGSEVGWTSKSQAGALTPIQQRMKRDFPPELPPRPQAQATDNDQHGQMYQ